ncbi:MAG: hypothetical protein ACERKK_07375 [Poseidonibacter sp.]|uniref:hypothetical protein n=1 Tax=Poseidonibacter sp. TaxID=2321188 RepID=UPI00359CC55C
MKILFLFILIISFCFSKDYNYLGNPYIKQYSNGEDIYARNIWDMQLFEGKIYLGAGNSSNKGPAQNAGRVYVVSLDPKTEKFEYEYKVAEEQIDIFKVYKNRLYIPGHDATQKWTYGNIYKKENNTWQKYRTLANALHVYDIVEKDGKIFTAIGLKGKGAVFVSDLNAKTWQKIAQGKGRVYSFIEIENEIFATKTFQKKYPLKLNITQWLTNRETFSSRFDLNISRMFPNTKLDNTSVKIVKSTKLRSGSLYIGVKKHNDHQGKPFGLYFISKDLIIKKIQLHEDEIPRDILVRGENIFLLINTKNENIVYKIKEGQLNQKEEVIKFKYPSFARSFEKYKDCFYFGIGSEVENPDKWEILELKKQTGDIIKVCK